jgi:hypothetical protein
MAAIRPDLGGIDDVASKTARKRDSQKARNRARVGRGDGWPISKIRCEDPDFR